MPTEVGPAFIIGLALFFGGGALVLGLLARHGGLAFGMQALRNIRGLLGDPERRSSARWMKAALLLSVVGGMVTCGAVMAGDAKRNRACRSACSSAGYPDGRFRGDPHVRARKRKGGERVVYRCWCRRDETWAPKPLELPAGH